MWVATVLQLWRAFGRYADRPIVRNGHRQTWTPPRPSGKICQGTIACVCLMRWHGNAAPRRFLFWEGEAIPNPALNRRSKGAINPPVYHEAGHAVANLFLGNRFL